MNNFINLRIQSAKATIVKHNFRTHNSQVSRNQIKDAKIPNQIYQLQTNNQYSLLDITDDNLKTILAKQKAILKKDSLNHRKAFKKRTGRNPKPSFNAHADGVLTFSEAIDIDLNSKYSKFDLAEQAFATIKEVCAKLGTTMIQDSLVFHYDETRLHAHWKMKNFDDDGRSIIYKNKKTYILSSLQDIAFKHLGKLGMDRGIKRVDSPDKRNHKTTQQFHEEKLSALVQQEHIHQETLQKLQETLELQKQENKKAVSELKNLRREITALNADKQHSKETVKNLYTEISTLQKEYRDANKKILSQEKRLKEQVKDISYSKLIQQELENSNQTLQSKNDDLQENIKDNTQKLEIIKGIVSVDEEAKTFYKRLFNTMVKKAKELATITPAYKLLSNISKVINPFDGNSQSMDYKFTAQELKTFLESIIVFATKEAYKPHFSVQKELEDKVKKLETEVDDKKDYVAPKVHKDLKDELSIQTTKNTTLKSQIEDLKTNTQKYDTDAQKRNAMLLNQNNKIKDYAQETEALSNKVNILKKQKSKLFEKIREVLYPQNMGLAHDIDI